MIMLVLIMLWEAEIIDIETAFLEWNLDVKILTKIPDRSIEALDEKVEDNDYLLLKKTIYRLE